MHFISPLMITTWQNLLFKLFKISPKLCVLLYYKLKCILTLINRSHTLISRLSLFIFMYNRFRKYNLYLQVRYKYLHISFTLVLTWFKKSLLKTFNPPNTKYESQIQSQTKNRPPTDKNEQRDICKINCLNYTNCYVGQTSRFF